MQTMYAQQITTMYQTWSDFNLFPT